MLNFLAGWNVDDQQRENRDADGDGNEVTHGIWSLISGADVRLAA
jgi:hypothetical protein